MANSWMKELPFAKLSTSALADMFHKLNFNDCISTNGNDFEEHLRKMCKSELHNELDFGYYSISKLNKRFIKEEIKNELSLIHLNIRSLNANYRGLLLLLSQIEFRFDIIVLSEIWSYNIEFFENLLDEYTFYYELPANSNIGGIGIFIKKTFDCTIRNDLTLKTDDESDKLEVESIWLEVSIKNRIFLVGGIYRHPGSNVKCFTHCLDKMLSNIPRNHECIIAGDINIDLSKYSVDKSTDDYLNNLISHNLRPIIVMPTRIKAASATIIDHIYLRDDNHRLSVIGGNILADLTDHLPNFLLINSSRTRVQTKNRTKIRLYTEKNYLNFRKELEKVNWKYVFGDAKDVSLLYDLFITEIERIFKINYPLTKISRRGIKDKEWITKGIKTSCAKKNKLQKVD